MKIKVLLMALIVLALLLSACGQAGNNAGNLTEGEDAALTRSAGSVEGPTPTAETLLDLIPSVEEATPDVQPTSQAVAASTLATNLINTEVAGQSGRTGQVLGMVMEASAGQMLYLLVRTLGEVEKTVLLPMGAYQVALLADDQLTDDGEILPLVWLTIPDADLADAPEVDPDIFASTAQLPAGWDEEASHYWASRVEGLPVTAEEEASAAQHDLIYLSASLLENFNVPVVDAEGEEIGEVRDYVVGARGEVPYAIVRASGIEDAPSEEVVVSNGMLNWDANLRMYVAKVSHEQLRSAPQFDRSELPDMSIPGWEGPWEEYWKQQSRSREMTPSSEVGSQVKISQLMGLPVVDVTDVELGAVEDLILGQNGTIQYLVVRIGELLRPVPWVDFEYDFRTGILIYLDDVPRLQEAPGFANPDEIELANPQWDNQIRSYWGHAQ